MEEDLQGYIDWITQAEELAESEDLQNAIKVLFEFTTTPTQQKHNPNLNWSRIWYEYDFYNHPITQTQLSGSLRNCQMNIY